MAPPGLTDAPAPWQLTGETFFFGGWSWTPATPPGSFAPSEREAISAASNSTLARTPFSVMLYRYKTSPVGPYDELMFLPGFYKTAVVGEHGKRRFDTSPRITRIYVSTDASIYNGRRNWNVPKHKADFNFEYSASGDIKIQVSRPGQTDTAFFSALVTPSERLPSFSLKTSWLPVKLDILQPPLPGVDEVAVETQGWKKTPLHIEQRGCKIAYIQPLLNEGKDLANGVDFPNILPLSIGVYCKDATVDFLEPLEVVVADLPASQRAKQD